MGDLILSSYERKYSRGSLKRIVFYWVSVGVLMTLFSLLIYNQKYGKSVQIQTALSLISLGAVFLILIWQLGYQFREKKSIEDYALEMEQMENVLYYLDIDTCNKLGLVMDEVKGRIEHEEREQHRFTMICYIGVAAVAGVFSFAYIDTKENSIVSQLGSVTNLFFILSTLLLSIFRVYICAYSSDRKYRWLYDMLMNIMITRY